MHDPKPCDAGRRRLLGSMAGMLCMAGIGIARAADFPSRPVRIIVPFVPGGSSDVVARVLAPRVGAFLRQQVIIENRPGAAGNLAVELTARATPDGHTMMLAGPGALSVNPLLYRHLRIHPQRALTPISIVGELEHAIIVTRNFPAKDLAGFMQYAKANPDVVTYGSSGIGATTHLCGALFGLKGGLALRHIAYKGAGQAMNDLIGGHIHAMFDLLPSAIGHIRGGSVRVLATTGAARAPQLSEVPTVGEAGLPGFVSTSYHALMLPAATPAPVVSILNEAVVKTLKDPEVVKQMAALGARTIPGTPEASQRYLRTETARWEEVIRVAQITLENS